MQMHCPSTTPAQLVNQGGKKEKKYMTMRSAQELCKAWQENNTKARGFATYPKGRKQETGCKGTIVELNYTIAQLGSKDAQGRVKVLENKLLSPWSRAKFSLYGDTYCTKRVGLLTDTWQIPGKQVVFVVYRCRVQRIHAMLDDLARQVSPSDDTILGNTVTTYILERGARPPRPALISREGFPQALNETRSGLFRGRELTSCQSRVRQPHA